MKTFEKISALVVTALLTTHSSATLIYYEGFLTGDTNYTVGDFLNTQNPSAENTNGAWAGASESGVVGVRVTETGLTYSGLPVVGGAAESFRTGTGTATGTYIVRRPAANNVITTIAANEILYFSALVNRTAGSVVGVGADFEGRSLFGVGFDSDGRAGIYYNSISNQDSTFGAWGGLTTGTYNPGTYLIVGRMIPTPGTSNTTATETIEFLSINPTDNIQPVAPVTSFAFNAWGENTGTDTLQNFNFLVTKAGSETVVGTVDELRWGKSYESVVAIPEPGTLVLVGVFLGSLVLLRRR